MNDIVLFLAGALLCNAIPHLVAGLQGHGFPTPFATPRGVGNSPPMVNFLWGAANLFLGLFLLCRQPVQAATWVGAGSLAVGFVVSGVFLAWHFGRVAATEHSIG